MREFEWNRLIMSKYNDLSDQCWRGFGFYGTSGTAWESGIIGKMSKKQIELISI